MTETNWNIFRAKFNDRESSAFERLCYFLFCNTHLLKAGIFRFKNQTGIETEPIEFDGKQVGFQAKYYGTKLADNKKDIISSIEKAKEANPTLQKILLYVNQEIGESSKKDKKEPHFLLDIGNAAKKLGIEVDWMVPSRIEHQLSLQENLHLAEYFFSLNKGIVDFLEEIRLHRDNILFPIQTHIDFLDKPIKIDREELIESVDRTDKIVAIISGDGGNGKTAVVKDYIQRHQKPIYLFKAAEFAVSNIAELFRNFGNYSLKDFIEAHDEEAEKLIIIDSAEKLSDLKNQDPFKEFLSALIKSSWRIIFTTRNSYLEDLTFQLLEIYRLPFEVLRVENIQIEQLKELSDKNGFSLPDDQKLCRLITNPFYLNEYLRFYDKDEQVNDIDQFKKILWLKKIQNSLFKDKNIHLERENTFMELARRRCENGSFYISSNLLDKNCLYLLSNDEIIQFDENHNGYFIAHDIYEEWALEKIVDRQYNALTSYNKFFQEIGTALPIRRAFRLWLSTKLGHDVESIKSFIEGVFNNADVEPFWKDELLISILLSEYSESFFSNFDRELLADDKHFLKKAIFLLRTACKEVDRMVNNNSQLLENVSFDSTFLITKPKGKGWEACISFLHAHVDKLDKSEVLLVTDLLDEWVSDNKKGETTRLAALAALQIYRLTQEKKVYYSGRTEEKLISVFLAGSREITAELEQIVKDLLATDNGDRHRKDDDILESILTVEHNAVQFYAALPEQTLALAEKFWYSPPSERHPMYSRDYGAEEHFGIADRWHYGYSPASAMQTPLYWTLYYSYAKSVKFYIDFINRAVEQYAKSGYDETLTETDVIMNGKVVGKQFISASLWNMYRGSGSPVTPYLLQSMHMALEKYFIEIIKVAKDRSVLEKWLLHLIKESRSASITAVVTSIVLAYPDDFFNVAAILFENYEFVHHDNWRLNREREAANIYKIGAGLMAKDKIHEMDRLGTLEDRQRKKSIEHQILEYQFFRNPGISEEMAEQRLERIQSIIDEHYHRTDSFKTAEEEKIPYRMLLARVDRRKMNPRVENKDDGFIIDFNPEMEPELKKHSDDALENSNNFLKYTSLELWATSKFDKTTQYGTYPQFDEDPSLVTTAIREIIKGYEDDKDGMFYFRNQRIPPYCSYALITEHFSSLSEEDIHLCRHVTLEFATAHLSDNYHYQISDGVEAAINTLPYLYEHFPNERRNFDMILLFTLFDAHNIGEYKRVCDYAIESIQNHLYRLYPENATRIFQAFYTFSDAFRKMDSEAYKLQYSSSQIRYSKEEIIEKFLNEKEQEIDNLFETGDNPSVLKIEKISFRTLETAFGMVPSDTQNPVYLDFASLALPRLCKKLMKQESRKERSDDFDYKMSRRFFRKSARFLLARDTTMIPKWTQPFIDGFTHSEESESFLAEIVMEEDTFVSYDQFWCIWNSLYEKLTKIANSGDRHKSKEIIHTYLLAWQYWKPEAKTWRSLKEKDKYFFRKASQDMGAHPSTLYGLAKFLNGVGSDFINDGVSWISDELYGNPNLHIEELDINTIYYLEIMSRKYAYANRTKLKSDILARKKLFTVLDFLVNNASVNAYLLREDLM